MTRRLPAIERLTTPARVFFAFNVVYAEHAMFGPHAHEDHEINLVVSGEAYYEHVSFGRVTMRQGDILLLPGGVPHRLVVPGAVTFRCFVIGVDLMVAVVAELGRSAEFARLCSPEKPPAPRIACDHGVAGALEDLYRQYLAESAAPDAWAAVSGRRLGELAAIQFARLMERPATGRPSDAEARAETIRGWIDRHFAEEVTLADLADMANLSPSHFSALFRRRAGMAPMAYLYRRRLDQAAILLARTNRAVTGIALGVGYENLEHFSRAFRAYAGASPLAFRKKHQV